MAPNIKNKASFKGRNLKHNNARGPPSAVHKKKGRWTPANKFFEGSLQEGQGFAFKRKQKVQHDYKKLIRKERRTMQDSSLQLKEDYPEHLKHLYMAEKKRLDEEEQMKSDRRRKGRAADALEDAEENITHHSVNSSSFTETVDSHEKSSATATSNEQPQTSQHESSSHKDTWRQRKNKKMSSYQKTKQEYERLKEERERKREEYLKDKAQREEALKRYKEKKMATYQLLKKKTKKGQPNLNLQMELLLQKIQAQRK
ncbi:thyroid transcription factor 1-associated protein 26 homolog isoform X1 [Hoplias malabaricus]|uniref:thyroid transcription factor 1-associated protein 26 homolog isoform X1 n=1 Tax=Hoplias malabaricus TaxID=27720 RepID=UPI00346237CB